MEYRATMAENGRIVIPKAIRDQFGLRGSQEIIFKTKRGKVELEPEIVAMRKLQDVFSELFKNYSVDDFIAERREEAKKESE